MMTKEQFVKIMKKLTQKMGEANWTPPKSFIPYIKLYKKMLKGNIDPRPKIDAALDAMDKNGEIPDDDTFVRLDIKEYEIGKVLIVASAIINVPGLVLNDDKWIAAMPMTILEIKLGIDAKLDFFIKYFFEILEAAPALVEIARMNCINIIPEDLELINSVDYMTKKDNSIMLGWSYEMDMDIEEILEKRDKVFETFKKVYHEIKYGLGI